MQLKYYFLFGSAFFALSACTQDQVAPVHDLGHQFYGRGAAASDEDTYTSANSYNNVNSGSFSSRYKPSPSYSNQSPEAASVSSVGVSDLAPVQGSKVSSAPLAPNGSGVSSSPSTPFSTPPSKPLDAQEAAKPGQQTTGLNAAQVYDKDSISLIWPVNGRKITAHFKGISNDGINISMSEGEPIMAAASGTVVYTGNELKDYGNMIIIRHDNGWLTAYANASKIVAKKNAHVKQGDIVAYVGSTGGVKTPQLHFALRKGKVPVDPEKYLPKS